MSIIQTTEQRLGTLVGGVCEEIVKYVLKELEDKRIIILTTQQSLADRYEAGNLKLDFLLKRTSDNKTVALWLSHRASPENSDAYLWGLLEEIRLVRAIYEDVICLFIVMGNKNGWKDWIFPASLLFFDYFIFLGDFLGKDLADFNFKKGPTLEEEAKQRFMVRETRDIDQIVRLLLDKYNIEPTKRALSEIIFRIAEGDPNSPLELRKDVSEIVESIRNILNISSMTANPFVKSLYETVFKHKVQAKQGAREIDISVYRMGILEFSAYLLLLYNLMRGRDIPVKKNELTLIISRLYPNEKRVYEWCEKAISNLIEAGVAVDLNNDLSINPKILLPLMQDILRRGENLTVNTLIYDFVYSILESKLTPPQRDVLYDLAKRGCLSQALDYVLKVLGSNKTGEIIRGLVQNHENILRRREEVLNYMVDKLLAHGHLKIEEGRIKAFRDKDVDFGLVIFYHQINKRSNLFDTYVLHLIDEYRNTLVEGAYKAFTKIRTSDELFGEIDRIDGEGIRLFVEVGIFSVGKAVKSLRNIIEIDRVAGTQTFAFFRGDMTLPTDMKKKLIATLREESTLVDWKVVSDEILKRRIQQIKRNPRANILEEKLYTYLKASNLIFLGSPKEQSDVYLKSILSDIGLSITAKEVMRGEDFILPTESGKCIVVACRASPQSYEARRMCGHSLQFSLKWVEQEKKWSFNKDMIHVAILDGHWKEKWIKNMLDSIYDYIFSSEELDELVSLARAHGVIECKDKDYEKALDHIISEFRRKELDTSTITREVKKKLQDVKGMTMLSQFF